MEDASQEPSGFPYPAFMPAETPYELFRALTPDGKGRMRLRAPMPGAFFTGAWRPVLPGDRVGLPGGASAEFRSMAANAIVPDSFPLFPAPR